MAKKKNKCKKCLSEQNTFCEKCECDKTPQDKKPELKLDLEHYSNLLFNFEDMKP